MNRDQIAILKIGLHIGKPLETYQEGQWVKSDHAENQIVIIIQLQDGSESIAWCF